MRIEKREFHLLMYKLIVAVILLLSFQGSLLAAETIHGGILIGVRESGVQQIRYADSEETLYNYNWELIRKDAENGTIITIHGRGDNNRKGEDRIEWTEESELELTKNGLRTLFWRKRSSGAEQETWLIRYDWTNRRAAYTHEDRLSEKKEEKTLAFGLNAYALDSINFHLRGFPFEKGKGTRLEGEFILTDGSVMEGAIVHAGEERLESAFGSLEAYKLEIDPWGFIGVFAPKMYLWFTKSKPHLFLRYDGKDDGLLKPRTVNELTGYKPKVNIHP